MNIKRIKAGTTIANLEIEVYKDIDDAKDEFSIYISEDGGSGYSINNIASFEEAGKEIAAYIRDM